jgi:cytochrome c oxidase cbb3-type subunit III
MAQLHRDLRSVDAVGGADDTRGGMPVCAVRLRLILQVMGVLLLASSLGALTHAQSQSGGGQAPVNQTPAAPAAGGQNRGRGEASPASAPLPRTATPQAYSQEQVQAGQKIFSAQCGFCHGRDAMGGESGPDLTRAAIVAEDVRGNTLGPVLRNGRVDKGMPAFNFSDADVIATVAFIHDQKRRAESLTGGRRTVEVADLQTGNIEAGKRYFDTVCTRCHSSTGDLAGIASRLQGLALLQRMLYPGSGRDAGPPPSPPRVTVTLASGQQVTGVVAYRDEFTIALTDPTGWYRSWPVRQVTFVVDDPLQAHVEQLGRYTDQDMHNVLQYLQTLRSTRPTP